MGLDTCFPELHEEKLIQTNNKTYRGCFLTGTAFFVFLSHFNGKIKDVEKETKGEFTAYGIF